ncbi:MAG: insulinase family protein [Ignavibacteriales bacterium]|nr:insulinase family protein [Ignavibacteriales bacterium]
MVQKTKRTFFILILLFSFTASLFGQFNIGETYHGFKLLEKKFVKEVNAECLYFTHPKSGARLFKIVSDNPNKTFAIAFKTITETDAGTPHMIEHGVLNGSKNYPVKSPFDVLLKGSLNTFLNAFTGSDMTMYPFASINEKDYFNIMHIYLDAVFNPLIHSDERIFQQEGWHYELTDVDSPIVYKGVVYNEMKGAFSSPDRELGFQIDKILFPDICYQYSSGGYPNAIPTLSYEGYKNYHKKYYHPSNSYIFLYGNADLNDELKIINSEYLNNYEDDNIEIKIDFQKPFAQMKVAGGYYSVSEGANLDKQTYLTLNYVIGNSTDQKLLWALRILSDVLVTQESAPIRIALQEAGIGMDVKASIDDLQQIVFQIIVRNAEAEQSDKFLEIVNNKLNEAIEKGLDKEAIQGILNRMEFRLREGDNAQKGLTYAFQMIGGWFYADNPFLTLEYESALQELKDGLENGYLESIIEKYFLNNPHSLLFTLEPKPGLEKVNSQKIYDELKEYKSKLNPEQLEKLVQSTNELIAYQQQEDSPEALAKMPLLELGDINREAKFYKIDIINSSLYAYKTFTNDVVYSRFNFDLRVIPQEKIPYAQLLTELLGYLNTKNYSFGDLDKQLKIHTGGFSVFLNTYLEEQDDNKLLPKFVLYFKCMNDKMDKMFELLNEITFNTIYTDDARLKDLLTRIKSNLDTRVKNNGLAYATTRLLSYYTNKGMYAELIGGLEYYWFITDLLNNFNTKVETLKQNLSEISTQLFTQDNLLGAITCAENDVHNFTEKFDEFKNSLSKQKRNYENWKFDLQNKNEGMLTTSKVQYVVKGYDFKKLGYYWNGKMLVLEQILSSDWLQTQIRVIGGAYGGWCSIQPNGIMYFASYRDPNLKETFENYNATPDYLEELVVSETDMTRYIIGTIAGLDNPLTPSQMGNMALKYELEKTIKEQIQKEREEVLSTTLADIKAMKEMVQKILAQNIHCVYGNEDKVQANKDLFFDVMQIIK